MKGLRRVMHRQWLFLFAASILFCPRPLLAGDGIEYYFSREIEQAFASRLVLARAADKDAKFHLVLYTMSDRPEEGLMNVHMLVLCPYSPKKTDKHFNNIVKRSNRYALINGEKIPLIFEDDFKFGVFRRDGPETVVREYRIFHSYEIIFNNEGDIIERNW